MQSFFKIHLSTSRSSCCYFRRSVNFVDFDNFVLNFVIFKFLFQIHLNLNKMIGSTALDSATYMYENNRLKSFKIWPFGDKCPCSARKMSEAGFYWCGNEKEPDTAACFMCGKTLDGWEESDDPWSEHRKHAPQCSFVKQGKSEKQMSVDEFLSLYEVFAHKTILNKSKKLKSQYEKYAESYKQKVIPTIK